MSPQVKRRAAGSQVCVACELTGKDFIESALPRRGGIVYRRNEAVERGPAVGSAKPRLTRTHHGRRRWIEATLLSTAAVAHISVALMTT